jgi:hypothetical protein
MNNPNWIHYPDEEGLRHFFYSPRVRIFRDGTLYSPRWGHRPLSPKHRKLLARYIENTEHETYQPEVCR